MGTRHFLQKSNSPKASDITAVWAFAFWRNEKELSEQWPKAISDAASSGFTEDRSSLVGLGPS